MSTIWRPTSQPTYYRGNEFSQYSHWRPTHQRELYHYGRKGMKWYKHIFGKINLKAMGTGVGNLLDEDKIKEIAQKLGIPLNQISKRMADIREYFRKERASEMADYVKSEPATTSKLQNDAKTMNGLADSVRSKTLSDREQDLARKRAQTQKEYDLRRKRDAYNKLRTEGSWEYAKEPYLYELEYKKKKEQERAEIAAQKRKQEVHENILAQQAKAAEERERYENAKAHGFSTAKEYEDYYWNVQNPKEVEQMKKEQQEYEEYKERKKKKREATKAVDKFFNNLGKHSGGGHKF